MLEGTKVIAAHFGAYAMWPQVMEKLCGKDLYFDTAFSCGRIPLLLGAESAVAVDIDPAAPATATENLELNGISPERYSVLVGSVTDDAALREKIGGDYDVVVANIVADVIIAISRTAYSQTRKGGVFITSGIIGPRGEEVRKAIAEAGFEITDVHEQSDWLCITAKKN